VLYGEKLICELGEGDELVTLTLVGDFPLGCASFGPPICTPILACRAAQSDPDSGSDSPRFAVRFAAVSVPGSQCPIRVLDVGGCGGHCTKSWLNLGSIFRSCSLTNANMFILFVLDMVEAAGVEP
jgi:hypothetical protein